MIIIRRRHKIKLYRLCTFSIGIVCLLLSTLAVAKPCDFNQLSIPDAKAMASVESLVKKSDPHAQAQLGRAYLRGYGVEKDVIKALMLLEKSANSGNKEAQYLLGEYFNKSGKTEKEFQKAAGWLKSSADQGCLQALLYLGMLTQEGKGVLKNPEAGLQMIYQSAESGLPMAQWWLGAILITGKGVKKDTKVGFMWTKRAADTDYSAAQLSLANLYLIGKGTEKNTEAAISLLEKVYAKNDEQVPMAAYMLGWTYMEGEGVPVNTIKAFSWMIIAANGQASDSQERLKILIEQLPKQKLVTKCSVYMDPFFASNNAKEYTHMSHGETVSVLHVRETLYEVYFPNHPMVGFIPRQCLDGVKQSEGEIKR